MSMQFRIGEGWDTHALVPGRRLVIGGVVIPFHLGLLGHSDADVLLHAITDALLGAAALGDIGTHFSDTDERWRGADSWKLLQATGGLVQAAGWHINNIDSTVIAQAPKLAPFMGAMREPSQYQGQNRREAGSRRFWAGDRGQGSGVASVAHLGLVFIASVVKQISIELA